MNGEKQFRPAANDFGDIGWDGPMPPEGHGPHHYYFWLYALDSPVSGMPDRETFLRDYGAYVISRRCCATPDLLTSISPATAMSCSRS